ncbi:MAG: DUF3303 family protein [Desulfobacterales bacterium]|nr:DUF3303 family protein [Desulfobacterales bacterium]
MVIEYFKPGCFEAIYERYNHRGRLLPEGLAYIESWVSTDKNVCFQLMETDNVELFPEWFRRWDDLIEFDIYPIDSSDR